MQLALTTSSDQRSTEILGAVRRAFVEKGFDGASMQDLARAAGMSVGNFYRYFPSKAAIIKALIAADLAEIQAAFETIVNSPDPMATLRQVLRYRITTDADAPDSELWTEIEAAARRSPEIGEAAGQMETEVISSLLTVFAIETGLAPAETAHRYSAAASFVMVLFKAASCMNCPTGRDQSELKAMIIRSIEQTLDDVTHSARKA